MVGGFAASRVYYSAGHYCIDPFMPLGHMPLAIFGSYRFFGEGGHELLLTQMIMNVVAFIHIGLFLGISFPNTKWWKVLLIGGAFSLLIETLRFLLKRGFAEFDDVFHNVVGCMIGYTVFLALTHIPWKGLKSLN